MFPVEVSIAAIGLIIILLCLKAVQFWWDEFYDILLTVFMILLSVMVILQSLFILKSLYF